MNVGIKAKPPDPLNSTREKDQVTHHPGNLVRGLTHLPLPFPHPFLNTYHLLKNATEKNSNHPKVKDGGKCSGKLAPPLELSGLPTSPPTPRQVDLIGGAGGGTKLSQTEKSQGRRQEGQSEQRRRQGRTERRKRTGAK